MTYLRIIFAHWIAILVTTVCLTATGVGLSFIPTQLYSSEVELLIIQEPAEYVDPYTTQKAAEKLGQNLVSVIDSFDFMNRVLATGAVSTDLFSSSTEQRKKQWQAIIDAEMVANTQVLHVTAYAPTAGAAEDIAAGVTTVLTTNSADYYGTTDQVVIKSIDGPVTSDRPVKPNIVLNGVLAGLLGFILAGAWFIVRAETERAKSNQLAVQYAVPSTPQLQSEQSTQSASYPVEYKVLDEYPATPYVYGAELKDEPSPLANDEPVSMQDHVK